MKASCWFTPLLRGQGRLARKLKLSSSAFTTFHVIRVRKAQSVQCACFPIGILLEKGAGYLSERVKL
jgi:hypothetical protein